MDLSLIKYIFKCFCLVVMFILIGMWLNRYLLDEDISVVESRTYFDTAEDSFPVMSICFEQFVDGKHFNKIGKDISGSEYRNFLLGEYFDEELINIDYNSVSTNITDFIISYMVQFDNESFVPTTNPSDFGKSPYYTHTFISWGRVLKCFGLEITNPHVVDLSIVLKRDIFPNGIRPPVGGFAVLFHYPNQVLTSMKTITREWKERDEQTNYWKGFSVKGMNVASHRYKTRRHNCLEEWTEYDTIVLEDHLKLVGCKTPDQVTRLEMKICNDTEKMKSARLYFKYKNEYIKPCREIQWIDLQLREVVYDSDALKEIVKADWKNWFAIYVRIVNPKFKITIQKKEIDFQSLVGYIGGYVGIFMGYTLAQIPETFLDTLRLGRILYGRIWKRKDVAINPIQQED